MLCLLIVLIAPAYVAASIWDALKETVVNAVTDKDANVRVEGHRWERKISTETRVAQTVEGWCSDRPSDAYNLTDSRRQRSSRSVEQKKAGDGKKYTYTQFVDFYAPEKRTANDGNEYSRKEFIAHYGKSGYMNWITAPVVKNLEAIARADALWAEAASDTDCQADCCPKCYLERLDDDWCVYLVDRWQFSQLEKASDNNVYPYWPSVNASLNDCSDLGCTREGKRESTYWLDLKEIEKNGKESKTYCTAKQGGWDVPSWRSMRVGAQFAAKRRIGYGILCGSIPLPSGGWEEKRIANDGTAYAYADFVEFYGLNAAQRWDTATIARTEEL